MARIDATELEWLKQQRLLSDVFANYGVRGRGKGRVIWAVCPFHAEKTASLKINDERGSAYCFGCGWTGDHISVIRDLGMKSFDEAVEALGGGNLLVTKEERQAIEDRRAKWDAEEREQREKKRTASQRLFDAGKPVSGTHVEAYLAARGLPVVPRWTFDLRYAAELPYHGFSDMDADEPVDLGAFPAMMAAIRDRDGKLIGLHRTYLDPKAPAKLTPPGDASRNKAKKVMGEQRGGMIQLSPLSRHLAIGEGIETSQAWYALGMADGDIAVAAGVSLGNLSGSATGTAPHPAREDRTVPNGIPDMDRPGLLLPRSVEHVTLIGDGDSDPYMTRARLLVAARRFHQQGVGVSVSMAPDKADFNDVLMEVTA